MKISYVTAYDAQNVRSWSGTPYYMSRSLAGMASSLEYVGPLHLPPQTKLHFRLRQLWYRGIAGQRYIRDADLPILRQFARQTERQLRQASPDVVFSPTSYTLAYLESTKPMVFWADATFASLIDYYPTYRNLCKTSIKQGLAMEQAALSRCRLAIFSSDWAANDAISKYDVDPTKVKVVPYGANLDCSRTWADIAAIIQNRPTNCCRLLFLGVSWQRKGGAIALALAKQLNQAGLNTTLTVAGCQPPPDVERPDYVQCLGFISKATASGRQQLATLLAESHFLLLPSLADCTPMVLCEANSFGTPCLSTRTGGIPTTIQDGRNGQLFDLSADTSEYCTYVLQLFQNYTRYQELAKSAFAEYQARLNWQVASQQVHRLLLDAI